MSVFVKICGITDLEGAEAAIASGVDALGFVFAESPREVTIEAANDIAEGVPDHVLRVAVFRRPDASEIARVVEGFAPDMIQADHQALHESSGYGTLPVFRDGTGVPPDGGRFLYEGVESGVGEQVDWQRAAGIARVGEMILAGGLRPDNVGRAITTVRPFGVDVSSGVESAPGVKSPALIRSFVAAVRAAEERLVQT